MQEKREKNSFYYLCTDYGKKSTNYAQKKSRFIGYTQSYPHYPQIYLLESEIAFIYKFHFIF